MVSGRVNQEPFRPTELCWLDTLASPCPTALPSRQEALPGVTARGLHSSTEEVVENKACTRLPIEGAVLE